MGVTVEWRCYRSHFHGHTNPTRGCDRCRPGFWVEGEPCPNPDCENGIVEKVCAACAHPEEFDTNPCTCSEVYCGCIDGVVPVGGSIVDTWGVPPTRAMIVQLKEDRREEE